MEDAKPNKTGPENANVGPPGLRTPAKGESSGSDIPIPREKQKADKGAPTPQPGPDGSAGDVTFVDASPSPTPGKARQLGEILLPRDHTGGRRKTRHSKDVFPAIDPIVPQQRFRRVSSPHRGPALGIPL